MSDPLAADRAASRPHITPGQRPGLAPLVARIIGESRQGFQPAAVPLLDDARGAAPPAERIAELSRLLHASVAAVRTPLVNAAGYAPQEAAALTRQLVDAAGRLLLDGSAREALSRAEDFAHYEERAITLANTIDDALNTAEAAAAAVGSPGPAGGARPPRQATGTPRRATRDILEFALQVHNFVLQQAGGADCDNRRPEWGPSFQERERELNALYAAALAEADETGFPVPEVERRLRNLQTQIMALLLWPRDAPLLSEDEVRQRQEGVGYSGGPVSDYLLKHGGKMFDAWREVESLALRLERRPPASVDHASSRAVSRPPDATGGRGYDGDGAAPPAIEPATRRGEADDEAENRQNACAADLAGRFRSGGKSMTTEGPSAHPHRPKAPDDAHATSSPRLESAPPPAVTVPTDQAVVNEPAVDPTTESIVTRAKAAEALALEMQRKHTAAEARFRRAYQAWERVRSFRGDRIPAHLSGKGLWQEYARLVVELGRVLKADGWQERVNAVQPGTDAKAYALAILRRAMEGNLDVVVGMLEEAVDTMFTLGLEADHWLREGLMYEVLDIRPAPEPPLHWEGAYHDAVETVEDLIKWLDQEFFIRACLSHIQGDRQSDGQAVRNAYRLVDKLRLLGMPQQPVGPLTFHQEEAVLRNLQRECRRRAAETIGRAVACEEAKTEGGKHRPTAATAEKGLMEGQTGQMAALPGGGRGAGAEPAGGPNGTGAGAILPELRGKVEEVRRAAEELRSVTGGWERWLATTGRRIEAFPEADQSRYGQTPAISSGVQALQLERRADLALRTLHGHRCLPPSLRAHPLEHALGLFPECPKGAIDFKRDKAFVEAVRQAMPRLRELGRDLTKFLDHLTFAPHSVIDSPLHRPPEPGDHAIRSRPQDKARESGEAANVRKGRGGRRRLEETNALKLQVYERIRLAHQPGGQHVDTVQALKGNKDFVEQVGAAGLKLNARLVRAALAFFDQRGRGQARKNQETGPT